MLSEPANIHLPDIHARFALDYPLGHYLAHASGAGYDLGSCCIAQAAYRHLDVDYASDDFISDIYLTGPTLGLEIKF